MPFASSRRYLGQRCFHNFGRVLNQPSTTNILCLSVFDINRHNAHLREISRPSKLLLRKMRGLPDFGFLGSFTRTQTARSQARKQTQIWLRCTRRCKVAFESSSWRSLDLEKGHWTIRKRSQRIARYRTSRLSARHSLRHVAPVRVSMFQKFSATASVFTFTGFQNLPWHREVVTLPNEHLDSQHDEGQFSECHLRAVEGIWASDVFTILAMF